MAEQSNAAPASAQPAAPVAQPKVDTVAKAPVTGIPGNTAATPAKPAVSEELHEVVIDGKPAKLTLKELKEAYQLRQLSDKKRSEADKTLSEYNKLFETFKRDPIKFMKATGVDFDALSTQYLSKKAEEAMMDPKERELQKARQEAEQYKKFVEDHKAAQEKAAKDAEIHSHREALHKEIIDAVQSESERLGLPIDEELVIQVATKMKLQDMKQKPLNAKEALNHAYESQQKYLKSMASKMSGEALIRWLGDEVAKKIRKYDLEQLKAKRKVPEPQSRVEAKPSTPSATPKYKTWSEFKKERLDKIV